MKKNRLLSNKRGFGIALFGIVLIVMLLFMALFYIVFDPIADRVYSMAENYVDTPNATTIITNAAAKTDNWLDGTFLFLFIGLWIAGLMIGYYSTDYGKLVLVVMIFILAALIFSAGILSEFWENYTDDNASVAGAAEYPYTYFVLNNFVWVVLIVLGSALVVTVVKDR